MFGADPQRDQRLVAFMLCFGPHSRMLPLCSCSHDRTFREAVVGTYSATSKRGCSPLGGVGLCREKTVAHSRLTGSLKFLLSWSRRLCLYYFSQQD